MKSEEAVQILKAVKNLSKAVKNQYTLVRQLAEVVQELQERLVRPDAALDLKVKAILTTLDTISKEP